MLRIRAWNETFENAKTRKLMHLEWIFLPSGVDSAGYLELMGLGQEGIQAFAVFVAICQWSATCRPNIRGSCARSDGKPLSVRQLALVLRMPLDVVENAIKVLSSPDVGWIVEDDSENTNVFQQSANDPPVVCQPSANDPPVVSVQGREGKGRERKGITTEGAKPEFVIPKKLDDPECRAAADKWFAYLDSKGLEEKSPVGNDIAMEEWWRVMARMSREDFLEAVSESIAAGRWNPKRDKQASNGKLNPKGRASPEWIQAQKAVSLHPTDWQKRLDMLGSQVFEALKRTGTAKVRDANSFELKDLEPIFESHLEDIRKEANGAA